MNKRILEIAKEAGLKFPSETALSPAEEKFAELIARECVKIVEDQRDPHTLNYSPKARTAADIKYYFGLC